jgi:hypothetical protein
MLSSLCSRLIIMRPHQNFNMKEKSINDWHDADSIDWEIYWEQIDTLDEIIKRDRNPKKKQAVAGDGQNHLIMLHIFFENISILMGR